MDSFTEIAEQANASGVITSGVITVVNWTMAPDGLRYLYFYCDRWEIITDAMMPVKKFRSVEHWQLAAVVGKEVLMLIPGCQVKGWSFCRTIPLHRESDCYWVK